MEETLYLVRYFVPKSEFGDKEDKILFWVFSEEEEGNMVAYTATDEYAVH